MVSGDLKARYFSLQRLGSLVNQPKMCALLTETGAENDLLVLLLTQVLYKPFFVSHRKSYLS